MADFKQQKNTQEPKEVRIFLNNAFFLLAHHDQIMRDSRMFLASVPVENYIVQNDVDNRKRQNPSWKIVGTKETTGCGTRGIYFDDPRQKGHMLSMNYKPQSQSSSANSQIYYNVIERGWKFYAERPWAAGLFYWTGFAYRGEPNPLSYPAHDSEFGILDYCGFPKDEAWYLKAWWTDEPVLHIFPHWNLQGNEGEEVELWAYSN